MRGCPEETRKVSDRPPQSLEQEMIGGGREQEAEMRPRNQSQLTGHGGMFDDAHVLNPGNCIQGPSR